MLEQIFYEMEDRFKSRARRVGFVVHKTAIDQDFLRIFRFPFRASFGKYNTHFLIHSFIHVSPTLYTLSYAKSLQSNILLLLFSISTDWHNSWAPSQFSRACYMSHTLSSPNNISEVKPTLTLQLHVYLQHLLVPSHWTSTKLKLCAVIMRCTGRESKPAGPSVTEARWPYCSMFRARTGRAQILRNMAVNDPVS
jgi:hypothetical protein